MSADRIPLAKILEQITSEIRISHKRATGAGNAVMRFQECEVEFAVEGEESGEGSLQIYVLKLGGGVKRSESNTIRIKYVALEGEPVVAEVKDAKGTNEKPKRKGKKVR